MARLDVAWIGTGRMGSVMARRALLAGQRLTVWNRTRSKAEPLVALGAEMVDRVDELRRAEVVVLSVLGSKEVIELSFGAKGLAPDDGKPVPAIVVDCSTMSIEDSGQIRARFAARGVQYLSAPLSGNPACVEAGKLSSIVSGPKGAFEKVEALIRTFAVRGVVYAGEGDLASICKLAHTTMIAAILENLIELMLLAQAAGVPRHVFLQFINNSIVGSIFTRYKSPALVSLDFKGGYPIAGVCQDVDTLMATARRLGIAMPITAATREIFQSHIDDAQSRPDRDVYLSQDFTSLIQSVATMAGVRLERETVSVASGLETV